MKGQITECYKFLPNSVYASLFALQLNKIAFACVKNETLELGIVGQDAI